MMSLWRSVTIYIFERYNFEPRFVAYAEQERLAMVITIDRALNYTPCCYDEARFICQSLQSLSNTTSSHIL